MKNQLTPPTIIIPSNLITAIQTLSSSLTSIAPNNANAQLITYTLIGTAVVGIFVYNYLRNYEDALNTE